MFWILAILIGSFAVLIGWLALLRAIYVEDWERDLTTNVADTAPDHPHPDQRPLRTPRSLSEAAAIVRETATGLPRWQFLGEDASQDQATLRFVRITPLMRYRDDVSVTLTGTAGGTEVGVHSQSRLGKGDLGQNPRNIRELIRALRPRLE